MDGKNTKTYRPWTPDCYRDQSHSPESKLPEGDLVFFLIDVIPRLDLASRSMPPTKTNGAGHRPSTRP